MSQKNIKTLFLFTLLLLSYLLMFSLSFNGNAAYLWFKEGVYVELRGEGGDVGFINGSFHRGGSDSFTILRWECVSFNGNVAEINVTVLVLSNSMRDFKTSICVFVNINSRDVYSASGEFYGKTLLWLPTNLDEREVVVLGYPRCFLEGTVTSKGNYIKTPYGYQTHFEVKFDTENPVNITYENKTYAYRLWSWLNYDLDTGLLLQAANLCGEGTLYALGILRIFTVMLIHETNVDLGPGLIWPEILNLMWFVIPPAVFFTVVFFAVYWRRRKRRKIARRRRR